MLSSAEGLAPIQLVVLVIVQALTEFLPVSSSGHLVLASALLGWPYQGLALDLGLHFGSLLALLVYFRRQLLPLVADGLGWRPGLRLTPGQRLLLGLGIATVPAAAAGLLLGEAGHGALHGLWVLGSTFVGFGLLLGWADWRAQRRGQGGDEYSVSLSMALLIGLFQALALVPGTSRSGIVMTAGLLLGLSREGTARYAFLLALPITALASAHGAWQMLSGRAALAASEFVLALLLSALVSYAVIHYFLRLIQRIGMLPFVVYRVLLGLVLLGMAAGAFGVE